MSEVLAAERHEFALELRLRPAAGRGLKRSLPTTEPSTSRPTHQNAPSWHNNETSSAKDPHPEPQRSSSHSDPSLREQGVEKAINVGGQLLL
jgi:hypothetical protein